MHITHGAAKAHDAAWCLRDSGITGGVIVQVGCGNGLQTLALRANNSCLVQGLDTDATNVMAARKLVADSGLSRGISIVGWNGKHLPYIDNLVNVLIDQSGAVRGEELLRVLVPGGVAYGLRGSTWTKTRKPVPGDIDEWTHFLHGPNNNAVAADSVVDNPRYLQWINGPLHARSHEHFQTVSAAVSAGGRLFSIVDEGPIAAVELPAKVNLIARDAFNGIELWRRPIGAWESHLRPVRSGPAWIGRRLVAVKNRVYVTLGYDQPVTALDAASGEVVVTFSGTQQASEIICDRGVLYVVISDPEAEARREKAARRGQPAPLIQQRIMALAADTGTLLWSRADETTRHVMPTTLAVQDGHVFFQNQQAVVCLHADTGKTQWTQPRATGDRFLSMSPPTLVVYDDVVLSADPEAPAPPPDPDEVKPTPNNRLPDNPGELLALSASDGRPLWRARCYPNFMSPVDVLVTDGVVWTGQFASVVNMGVTGARDLHTGRLVRKRPPDNPNKIVVSHSRCHRIRATDRFLLLSRAGVDLLDVKTGEMKMNHWVRGTCQHGPLPCNGLLYVPPHACDCYPEAMLHGFAALASARRPTSNQSPGFEKGPAFEASISQRDTRASSDNWPTYRGDAARSGATSALVPLALKAQWQQTIGGHLSAPTVAGGTLFVSEIDAHTLHALDAATGRTVWTYTTGGRVDSPPTVVDGRAVFGCADGWVYCLRAADGAMIWRFRAAPNDEQLVAFGELESVWPVPGSVLAKGGTVYFAAGRSSYLDGGMWIYRLDLASGKELARVPVDSRDPVTGLEPDAIKGFDMPGLLNDVMSADDAHLFLRQVVLGIDCEPLKQLVPHLFSSTGFLDSTWWHRSYWLIGPEMHAGFRDWGEASQEVPHARLFCLDHQTAIGFGRTQASQWISHVGLENTHYELYAIKAEPRDWQAWSSPPEPYKSSVRYRWRCTLPMLARAMVLAGGTLFVAGPPDVLEHYDLEAPSAVAGQKGGALRAISAADGKTLASYPLGSPPVFDGMAATDSQLFMSTVDGHVVCFAPAEPAHIR